MKGPDFLRPAGEDEKITLRCHSPAKDWDAGWVWRVVSTNFYLVPWAGVMSTSTHLSSLSHPAWASFIWLLLHFFPQQGLTSPILTRLVFDISTPYPYWGQLWSRGLGGHRLRPWNGEETETLCCCQGAGYLACNVVLHNLQPHPRTVTFPSRMKHQKCLSYDGKGQNSLFFLRKSNLRRSWVLRSRMGEGIYWTWFLVWICLTKAFFCASKPVSHFWRPQNPKGFKSCFWTVVGIISSLQRSLICGIFPPRVIAIWHDSC